MESKIKLTTVVLISHRSKNLVLSFIKNLTQKIQILIIDNSKDEDLKKEISKYQNIKIIFMENKGYGSAINYARTFIKTKYFFIFSPDVNNVSTKLISIFENKANMIKKFGAIGPRFLNVKEKSHRQTDVKKKIGNIDSISGAAMFFDTNIFDDIGGFDENFFLYFEETDYCKRARKKGYKIYQLNNTKVGHNKGLNSGVVTTKNTEEEKNLQNLYSWHFIWSKHYYHKKHYGKIYSIIYFVPTLIRILFRICLYKITRNDNKIKKYNIRLDGLLSSIMNIASVKRL